jgi:N-acetylmuramidase/Putative peptidoglycan binding domain
MELEPQAALRSTSWGISQIMGFNAQLVGFSDVNAMLTAMIESEDNQLVAMATLLKGNRLDGALRSHDWRAFARGFNGPNFEQNNYHKRLEAAFAHYSVLLPDLTVRTAQVLLTYLGFHPGAIDGVMGSRTSAALEEFQHREGLPDTGNADPGTVQNLRTKVS